MEVPQKMKNRAIYDLVIPLLRIYRPPQYNAYEQPKDEYNGAPDSMICNRQTWKQLKDCQRG